MTNILRSVTDLRAHISALRARGSRIAFVPTMGALHDGHISLMREGIKRAESCIASIFVNPTQFGPHEDFASYPRTLESDCALLRAAGVNAVYAPDGNVMYPDGFTTTVHVAGVTEPLEGANRPGHFDGVATVVAKLLLQVMPDIALFGEKDWQQLQTIRRLVTDLNIPVEIIGVPTARDNHGLALSSRNAYLSPAQLIIARRLNKILFEIAAAVRSGSPLDESLSYGRDALTRAGFDAVDYLEIRVADTLAPAHSMEAQTLRLLAAVRVGRARLIDNIAI